MRLILKSTEDMGFDRTTLDVDIHATPDHIISALTMKYNTIDATKLVLYFNGRLIPDEADILKFGLVEDSEVDVRYKRSCCCTLV